MCVAIAHWLLVFEWRWNGYGLSTKVCINRNRSRFCNMQTFFFQVLLSAADILPIFPSSCWKSRVTANIYLFIPQWLREEALLSSSSEVCSFRFLVLHKREEMVAASNWDCRCHLDFHKNCASSPIDYLRVKAENFTEGNFIFLIKW